MNSEGVYRCSEMLGVDLAKFLAPAVVFEVVVHHVVRHLPGTNTVDLENLQSTTVLLFPRKENCNIQKSFKDLIIKYDGAPFIFQIAN